MHRCSLLLTLTLISATLLAQKTHHGTDPFAGLDTAFARALKDWHAAGFAVAVVDKQKVIYTKGFGYKDFEKKIPVTPHTLFAIGSCTKAFTASLIGMLNDKGTLDIDRPVRNYLPELKFYNATMNDHITLRDMMCHRTGLPRHDLAWYLFKTNSRDSLIQRIQYMEPSSGIRERWQYNNFMFMAQGVVVEKLTGKTWEDNIRERLLQPLGMSETNLSINDMIKTTDFSFGYDVKKDSIVNRDDYYIIDAMGPAGSINSNVLDMANWVTTWINGGKLIGKVILPAGYVQEAMSSQMVMGGALPSKEAPDVYFSTYGFGWMLSSYRGHYRVEHGGNIDGFSASTCFFPADSIGIIVLSNQSNSQVPSIVRNLIADRLLHLPYQDWDGYLKAIADKARSAAKMAEASKVIDHNTAPGPTHPLTDYTGAYQNPGYGSFEVALRHDSLLAFFSSGNWWLKPDKYDIFTPYDDDPRTGVDTSGAFAGLKLQFNMDLTGNISSVSGQFEPTLDKSIVFSRAPRGLPLDSNQLKKYVGEYSIGPQAAKVYTKGNTLFLLVPGQPEYELVNVGPDKFALKSLSGYFAQFVIDDQGQVNALLAIQPNGTFKATRKK
jgi:CubicO group peptidase (beta-lactamase class C family)